MKNIIKILMFVILGSMCLGSVFATTLTTGLVSYYTFDENTGSSAEDSVGTNDGTVSNVNIWSSGGFINSGIYNPTGTGNQNVNIGDIRSHFTNAGSVNMWVKSDGGTGTGTGGHNGIFETLGTSANSGHLWRGGANEHYTRIFRNDRLTLGALSSMPTRTEWHMWTFTTTPGSNGYKVYVNGVEKYSATGLSTIYLPTTSYIYLTPTISSGLYIDEVGIWSRALTQEEITELYNFNDGNQYPFFVPTPIIQADVQDFYNSQDITINLNSLTNTNMSYSLDNGTITSICNDCNNSVLELFSLIESPHSILFVSEDENGQKNSSYNFTIDLTDPIINVFNTSKIETYSIDWTNVFNYSDDNLDSCWIIVENSTENCSSYTFSENGNQSVQVYVNDSAGNLATESFTIFVDPKVYVYFEDPATNPISNFTFGGNNYSNYAEINIYDLGLGSHTLEFVKYGYARTNITLEFTSTSNINTTETIQVSLLYINIRDRETENLITDTINFDLIGESYAGSYSTSNGLKTITDITELPGVYRLTFTGTGYAINDYYFQHTGFSSVNITTYLINESETLPIKIILRDIFSNPKSACLIKVKQYFISENNYIAVDMKTTNSLGEVIFDLQYAKWYQFVIECDGITQAESGQQITSTPLFLTWDEDDALTIFKGLANFAYEPIKWVNTSNSTGYFRFEYNDLNNIVSQGCLYVYEKAFKGNILINSSCVNSASATININANYIAESGKTYIARGFVTYQGETTFVHEGSITFMRGAGTWDYGLGSWGSMLLIGVLFLIGAALHPFAGIAFAWIGAAVSVKFEMLPIDWAALIGIGVLVVGLIIFRGKK